MSSTEPHAAPVVSLAYATETPRQGARVWAAIAILLGGIALIGLGGCFLIVVLAMYSRPTFGNPAAPPITPGGYLFITILYALAFGCFAGAVVLIIAGVRGLMLVVRGR